MEEGKDELAVSKNKGGKFKTGRDLKRVEPANLASTETTTPGERWVARSLYSTAEQEEELRNGLSNFSPFVSIHDLYMVKPKLERFGYLRLTAHEQSPSSQPRTAIRRYSSSALPSRPRGPTVS